MQSKKIVFQALDGAIKARPGIEEAASNGPSDALYKEMVAHLDELLDGQLTALIEAVRAVQVEHETEKILMEAV
ncbi:Uncharacterised protein [uncultured archaeon]|nr:Uncharacterised protein [uncultured archaeon]